MPCQGSRPGWGVMPKVLLWPSWCWLPATIPSFLFGSGAFGCAAHHVDPSVRSLLLTQGSFLRGPSAHFTASTHVINPASEEVDPCSNAGNQDCCVGALSCLSGQQADRALAFDLYGSSYLTPSKHCPFICTDRWLCIEPQVFGFSDPPKALVSEAVQLPSHWTSWTADVPSQCPLRVVPL